MGSRPRGAIVNWAPQAKTRKLLGEVAEIFETYAAHLPLTLRQVFYRLVASHDFPKTEQAYQRLIETVGKARRAGLIDHRKIRDDGVVHHQLGSFNGVPEFLNAVQGAACNYVLDRRIGQPFALEVWCEAAGMVPQLANVCDSYGVPVFSGGGFDSLTAKVEAARRAAHEGQANGRTLVVLHIGDHDPSGLHVFVSVAEDVAAWAHMGRGGVEFHRVAVTPEQVEEHSLAIDVPKTTDRRRYGFDWTCQAEALDPGVLASLVVKAIEERTDLEQLEVVIAREDRERERLQGLVAGLSP